MKQLLVAVVIAVLGARLSVLAFPNNYNPFQSSQYWIEKINNDPESTWTAGENFDPNLPPTYIKKLLGLRRRKSRNVLPVGEPITDINALHLPKTFDARKKWKHCKSLQEIRDQGDCGSCWAVSAASTFGDRLCISKKGKLNDVHLSAEEVLACCTECGYGCEGGYDDLAWDYFAKNGIVSGGDYNSSYGCQPYSLQPCEHHTTGPRPQCQDLEPTSTPTCMAKCTNKQYTKPFTQDHHKVKSGYYVSYSEIQKEIYKNGPVQAGFDVYDDFLNYKKGVYKHSSSSLLLGGHAVKVIGWGMEKRTPYWLVQNSWNTDWGDKGLFKILRGSNECFFESEITAGIPS